MRCLKYVLSVLLCLSCALSAPAQEVLYSQYDKFDSYTGDYAVVGVVGGVTYTYRYNEENAMLDAYDDSMNKTATIMLDFMPPKIYQIRFIAYPDRIVVLYQALEGNKVILYAALLDARARLRKRPVELASAKTGLLGATKSYFFSAVSDDKKQIVTYSADEKNREIVMDCKWLDDSLKITNRSHAVFSTENDAYHGEVNVGNDGTVYMAAYVPVGNLNYAESYWILSLTPGDNKFSPAPLPLNGKFAANGYIKIDNYNKRVYFGGFYADKKNGNFSGIIYSALNTDEKGFNSTKFLPIDNEMSNTLGAAGDPRAFNNFEVKQLIVKNDGGFVLVSEIHFITTRSNYQPGIGAGSFYSSGVSSITREFHFNDILALSYDKDGKREWASVIPKIQYSQDDNGTFSSYALLNSGGSLAFLYNDFNRNNQRIQLATIDADGKTNFHSFNPDGNDNPDWIPRMGKQIGARTLLIPCLHKKEMYFVKVGF